MPNTLVHIGLQGPLTRIAISPLPLQWVALGCLIPDLPWISQRILRLLPMIDPFWLRIYAAIQASLFFSLLLCALFALLSKKPRSLFLLLAANATLHLAIDATQIKWANVVHFLAPLSWQAIRFDLFWPEHYSSYLGSGAGLLVLALFWKTTVRQDLDLALPKKSRLAAITLLLLSYSLGPFLFL